MTRVAWICFVMLIPLMAAEATEKTVQSLVVKFPLEGRVIVQAKEEAGQFPSMVFISERTGREMLRRAIKDEDLLLVLEDSSLSLPTLRFTVIRSTGFNTPLILSVGVSHGGSDNRFYLTAFGEVTGRLRVLNDRPLFANIQGGFYLGRLNNKLGYGLVAWNFIWGHDRDEVHYTWHHYDDSIFKLRGARFERIIHRVSTKKYKGNGAGSLREIGITVVDQRWLIPD